MLKGDLAATPLPQVLRQLADGGATGCLHVVDPADAQAQVYLRSGSVYAVALPGTRATPEAVEAVEERQVREDLADLLLWHDGTWRFRVNQRSRGPVAPPVAVRQLLTDVQHQRPATGVLARFHPDAVPVLSAAGSTDAELVVDGDARSLLCAVDGNRTVAELARDGGLTLSAARSVLHGLVQAGLLEVEAPRADTVAVRQPLVPADGAARLASGLAPVTSPGGQVDAVPEPHLPRRPDRPDDAEVEQSISRVSAALAAVLGHSALDDDLFAAPSDRRAPAPTVEPWDPDGSDRDAAEPAVVQAEHVAEVVDLKARRGQDSRLVEQTRQADDARHAEPVGLAEPAHAVAAVEVSRLAAELDDPTDTAPAAPEDSGHRPDVVDDQTARASAQLQADAFAELSAAATHVAPPSVVVAEPAPEAAAEPGVVLVDEAPARSAEGTDTAALLRELSSLGFADDPLPPQPNRPVSSAPRPSAGPPKKRKGLFGR